MLSPSIIHGPFRNGLVDRSCPSILLLVVLVLVLLAADAGAGTGAGALERVEDGRCTRDPFLLLLLLLLPIGSSMR